MSAGASLPSSADFRYCCTIEVRFRDLDAMAHVNNATYLTYFEVARTGYMQALEHAASDAPALPELFPFILAEIHCRFLAPASLGDRLRVHLRTTRLGSKSFEFQYLITTQQGANPVAVGSSTQVYFDYAAQQTLPLPATFRERIEQLEGRSLSG